MKHFLDHLEHWLGYIVGVAGLLMWCIVPYRSLFTLVIAALCLLVSGYHLFRDPNLSKAVKAVMIGAVVAVIIFGHFWIPAQRTQQQLDEHNRQTWQEFHDSMTEEEEAEYQQMVKDGIRQIRNQ